MNRPTGVGREHGLAHPLLGVGFLAYHGEAEDADVPFNRRLERAAGDPHVIDSQQHGRYRDI
jgi:hypothetical protein